VSTLIFVLPNWLVEFHVHVDTLGIYLGALLLQYGEDSLD
jgi:hypothetical protein